MKRVKISRKLYEAMRELERQWAMRSAMRSEVDEVWDMTDYETFNRDGGISDGDDN